MEAAPSIVTSGAVEDSADRVELVLYAAGGGPLLMSSLAEGGGRHIDRDHAKTKATQGADKRPPSHSRTRAVHKIPAVRQPEAHAPVRLSPADRGRLRAWATSRTLPSRLVVRSRIVLLASEGLTNAAIGQRLHIAPATARLWCSRFQHGGPDALTLDAPGRGRPSGMARDKVLSILRAMLVDEHTRSARRIAERAGTSLSSVRRVWGRYGLSDASTREEVERVLGKLISETEDGPVMRGFLQP